MKKIGAEKKKFPRSVPVHSLRVVTDGDRRVLTRSGKKKVSFARSAHSMCVV